jgi:hypothetical protein
MYTVVILSNKSQSYKNNTVWRVYFGENKKCLPKEAAIVVK